MNNRSNRPTQNYNRVQGQNPGQRRPSRPPVQPGRQQGRQKEPAFDPYIIAEALLLLLASFAALMFCSFLKADFHFDYVETVSPSISAKSSSDEPSDRIYELELPKKEDPIPPEKLTDYDFSQPVPECGAYPVDYFDDTVFIGDSRTAGLIMYTKLSPIDYSATGFNINNLSNKAYISHVGEDGNKTLVTCREALELDAGKYKSIYISTGVNELGWNASNFVKAYRNAIASIREVTDVPIYIQLILPVTNDYSQNSTNGITNEKQTQFNEKLRALALEEEVFLLDPISLFALEDGSLDPEVSFDGAHLQKSACKELLEYYQTHVVDVTAYANTLPESEPDGSDVNFKAN